MACEEFTAVAMCPNCGAVDVWPWREPRYAPKGDTQVERMQRKLASYSEAIAITSGAYWHDGSGWWGLTYDPDDAVVVRQCTCGHEWGQR